MGPATVSADAWVQAGTVAVVALVGGALAAMRGWARRVETKIDHEAEAGRLRSDLVAGAVAKTTDELVLVRERLAAVETSLGWVQAAATGPHVGQRAPAGASVARRRWDDE